MFMSKKSDTTENGGNKRPRFSFLTPALFAVLVLIGHVPLWFFPYSIIPFQKFMVKVVGGLISSSGLHAVQDGVNIYLANTHWIMTPECTALSAIVVFLSFVIAYPASLKSKGIAIATGVPFLVAANTLRLFTLAWATKLFNNLAHLFHDYIWQIAFLILIAIMWLVWIELVVNRENKAAVSG